LKDESHLTDLQLAVMRSLWDRPEARVHEVLADLQDRGIELAPTTVATLLTRLEKRGLLAHRREGRQYVYRALVPEHEVRRSMLSRLTQFFFAGDPGALVSHLVGHERIDPRDRAAIARLLEHNESDPDPDGR
jgi:predicted transcriptional regulator